MMNMSDHDIESGQVIHQETHHRRFSWEEELKKLFEEHGVQYEETYLSKDAGH